MSTMVEKAAGIASLQGGDMDDLTILQCDREDQTVCTLAKTISSEDDNSTILTPHKLNKTSKLKPSIRSCDTEDDDELKCELSWRLNPTKSLSDWTIRVQTLVPRVITPLTATLESNDPRPTSRIDEYHVHKSVLGVGPRRSIVLARMFANHEADKKKEAEQRKQAPDMQYLKDLFEESLGMVTRHGLQCMSEQLKAKNQAMMLAHPVTILELEAPAAEAFPALLDFMYSTRLLCPPQTPTSSSNSLLSNPHQPDNQVYYESPTELVDISTHTATALHHLAVRLRIKPLLRLATEFLQMDATIDNVMVYYTHARIFRNALVLDHAARVLATSILDMEEKMVIYFLQALDADFFLIVLQCITNQHDSTRQHDISTSSPQHYHRDSSTSFTTNNSENAVTPEKPDDKRCDVVNVVASDNRTTLSISLSLLVAIYCNLHRDELGAESLTMFDRLTDEKWIPVLDVKAAQVFLDIEQELKDDSSLTSLKKRCIEVISHNWNTALVSRGDYTNQINLPPLNGEALRHFTLLTLTRATAQLDENDFERTLDPIMVPSYFANANKRDLMMSPPSPSSVTPPTSPKPVPAYSSNSNGLDHRVSPPPVMRLAEKYAFNPKPLTE